MQFGRDSPPPPGHRAVTTLEVEASSAKGLTCKHAVSSVQAPWAPKTQEQKLGLLEMYGENLGA